MRFVRRSVTGFLFATLYMPHAIACGPYGNLETHYEFIGYSSAHRVFVVREQETDSTNHNLNWTVLDANNGEPMLGVQFSEDGSPRLWENLSRTSVDATTADLLKSIAADAQALESASLTNLSDDEWNARRDAFVSSLRTRLAVKELKPAPTCAVSIAKGRHSVVFPDAKTGKMLTLESTLPTTAFQEPIEYTVDRCLNSGATLTAVVLRSHGLRGYGESEDSSYPLYFDSDNVVLLNDYRADALRENTLGFRALKKRDYASAREHFRKSLALDSSYPHANFNMACTLSLMGEPFATGKDFLVTILDQPKVYQRYLKKIQTDSDLDNWRRDPAFKPWFDEKSKPIAAEISVATDGDASATKTPGARGANSAGMAAYRQKNYPEAAQHFQRAVELDPSYDLAHTNLACVYSLQGNIKAALEQLHIAHDHNRTATIAKMKADRDFDSLRNNAEFQALLSN